MGADCYSLQALSQLSWQLSGQPASTLAWLADLRATLQSVSGVPHTLACLLASVLVVTDSQDIIQDTLDTLKVVVNKEPSLVSAPPIQCTYIRLYAVLKYFICRMASVCFQNKYIC